MSDRNSNAISMLYGGDCAMLNSLTFSKARVLVIGDLMLDTYKYGKAYRVSPEAPVPVVLVLREDHKAGGAANVAVNLKALGCYAELLGYVGDDSNGRQLQSELRKHGVIHDNLIESMASTISKTRIIANHQHVVRYDDDSTMTTRTHRHYYEGALIQLISELSKQQSFDIVVVSDYAKGTITEAVMDSIKASFSCKILCDIKPVNANLFKDVFCVVPNLTEALQLVDVSYNYTWPELAGKIKSRLSLEAVVITLSKDGIFLLDQHDKTHLLKAHTIKDYNNPNRVLDITGAGDTVISTLAVCLAIGYNLAESVRLANLAAAVVVGKIGTAMCSIQELENADI